MFKVEWSELEGRYDPFYYHPEFKELEDDLERIKFPKKTVKEIAESIFQGRTQGHKETMGLPVLKVKNITQNGFINFDNVEDFDTEHNKTILKYGDILLPFRGQAILLNKVAIFKKEIEQYLPDNNLGIIRLFKSKDINPMFVTVFLQSSFGFKQIRRILGGGTGVLVITKETIGTIKIPIPPRPIQDRVAEIMEEAYKQRKEKLKEAEDLFAGINDFVLEKLGFENPEVEDEKTFVVTLKGLKVGKRHDVFYYQPKYSNLSKVLEISPYPLKTVGDVIFSIANGYDYRNYVEIGTPYLRVENVISGKISLEKVLFIDKSINQINKDIKLDRGDVLFTRKGSFGRVAVVEVGHKDCVISSEIMRIKLMDEINPYYFSAFMNSKAGFTQSERKAVGAMNYSISQPELKTIKIPVPPIEIQNEIAKEVKRKRERAEKLKQEAEEIIKQTKEEVERMILGEEID